MKKVINTLILVLGLILFSGLVLGEVTNHVVISEVLINDNFVELYNPTSQPIDISGWKILTSHPIDPDVVFYEDTIIDSHGFYLIASASWRTVGKTNPNWPDADRESDIIMQNNVELELVDLNGAHVDSIAWRIYDQNFDTIEGDPIDLFDFGPTELKSFERISSEEHDEDKGNGYDTDDNSVDFVIRDVPEPQNSSSDDEHPPIGMLINEIMYNPLGSDSYDEWIEIYNFGLNDINLEEWTLCGDDLLTGFLNKSDELVYSENDFLLSQGEYAIITDGGSGTLVYNTSSIPEDALAFHVDADSMCTGLSNSGEELTLADDIYTVSVDYEALAEQGYSLERYNLDFDNWGQSLELGGTPGSANSIYDSEEPVISDASLEFYFVQTDESVVLNVSVTDDSSFIVTVDEQTLFQQGDTDYWTSDLVLSDLESPITILATDIAGNTATDESLEFTIDDDLPIITVYSPIGDLYDTTNVLLNISINEEGDCYYTLNQGDELTLFEENQNGSVMLSALDSDNDLEILCLDFAGNEETETLDFTVNTNHGPIIYGLGDMNVSEDSLFSYELNVSDEDVGDVLTYLVEVEEEIELAVDSNGLITWTPTQGDVGEYTIGVKICDDSERDNNCTTGSFVLEVLNVNGAPVINELPNITSDEDTAIRFNFTDYLSDIDNETLDLTLSFDESVNENENIESISFDTVVDNFTVDIVPKLNYFGEILIDFTVSDGELTGTNTLRLNITPVEENPFTPEIVYPENNKVVNLTLFDLQWNLTGDPDGDTVTYHVYLKNETDDDFKLLGSTESGSLGVDLENLKSYSWKIIANDSMQDLDDSLSHITESEVKQFSVLYNNLPVISSTPLEVGVANQEYTYQVAASDADAEDLEYELLVKPEEMKINDTTGLIEWSPNLTHLGMHSVKLNITDEKDFSVMQEYNLTVKHPFSINYIKMNGEEFKQGQTKSVNLSNELTFEFEFENLFSGREIELEAASFDIIGLTEEDEVVKEFKFDLDPLTTKQDSLIFPIPTSADEGTYELNLSLRFEDYEGNEYFIEERDMFIDVGRQRHHLIIQDISLSPQPVNSGGNTELRFVLSNLGTKDERDITLSVKNANLGIDNSSIVDSINSEQNHTYTKSFVIPEEVLSGSYPIEIKAVYDFDMEISKDFYLQTNHINLAPSITQTVPDLNLNEDTTYTFDLTNYGNDVEDSGSSLVWSVSGVDTNLMSISINPSTDLMTIVPVKDKYGTDEVTLSLIDSDGLLVSQKIDITISSVEDGIDISNKLPEQTSLIIREDEKIDFSISVSDPDDSFVVSWIVNDKFVKRYASPIGNIYSYTFDPSTTGTYEVIVMIESANVVNYSWTVTVTDLPVSYDFSLNHDISKGVDKAVDVKIDAGSRGKIDFGSEVIDLSDVADIDNNVRIQTNIVAVNSNVLSAFKNKKATITMKVSSLEKPVIYYNNGFTTDQNDLTSVCDFCKIISHDKSAGILVFSVDHFTSFTAKDKANAYSLSIDHTEIIFDDERGTEQSQEIVIENTGYEVLDDIEIALIPEYDENISMKLESGDYVTSTKLTLGPGLSQKLIVRTFVSEREQSRKSKIGSIDITNKDIDQKMILVYQNPPSKLKIVDVEIDDSEDDYSIDNNGHIDDIKPGSVLKFTVDVENKYDDDDNDDYEIKSIEIQVEIRKILKDGDKDLDEDTDSFRLDPDESEDRVLTFDIPLDVNDKSAGYDVIITVDGRDGLGVNHEDTWNLDLFIEKEDHDLRIVRSDLASEELSCDRSTHLDLKIKNYGAEEEKDVVLEITNSELNINERYTSISDLETDVFDDDSEFSRSFNLFIPEDAKAKEYPISVIVYYDDDEEDDKKIVNLDVKECITEKEIEFKKDVESGFEDEDLFEGLTAEIYQQQGAEDIDYFKLDDSWETTLMICGFVILAGIVLFMFLAIFAVGKKKRRY